MSCPCECHNGPYVACSILGGCGLDYHRPRFPARRSLMASSERRTALRRLLDPHNEGDRESDIPASIPYMFDQLDLEPGRVGNGVRRAPGFGSQPPLSINILVMLDDRSQVGSPCTWYDPHPTGFGDDWTRPHVEEQNPPRAIRKALSGLVGALYEEAEAELIESLAGLDFYGPPVSELLPRPAESVSALCQWLFDHLERVVNHLDVEEIHADLTELSEQLRRAIGDGPADPIGDCIELVKDRATHELTYCGESLYLPPARPDDPTQTAAEIAREIVTTCSRCHRKYRRLDLVRVRVSQDAA